MRNIPVITCIGETLIDFFAVESVSTLSDATRFERLPGGAAANVCVGIAKLGVISAFIGCVGNDAFGKYLKRELATCGVDVSCLQTVNDFKTRLAFVSVSKDGERDFDFWERVPADTHLRLSGSIVKKLSLSSIIHFGSLLLTQEPARSTILSVAAKLHNNRSLISFDPNLRLSLWKSHESARRTTRKMIELCDILRLNEEEAYFLSKKSSLAAASAAFHRMGPSVVVVTLGNEGCLCSTLNGSTVVEGFDVEAIDTTGCGDAFLAGLLTGVALARNSVDKIQLPSWFSICQRANAAGALTATKKGGISALPTARQIESFLKKNVK